MEASAWDLRISQNVIFLSWPTEMYLLVSIGEIAMALIPPILRVWFDILFWDLRSQQRIDLSREQESKWISSENMCTLVTLDVCSFRWAISSLDLISQTRISPSCPPETMNLLLWLNASAVTPFLCALSICQSCWLLSTLKARILPSDHPESTISSVKREQVGWTPEILASMFTHLALTE